VVFNAVLAVELVGKVFAGETDSGADVVEFDCLDVAGALKRTYEIDSYGDESLQWVQIS
jgi:hypothetical protein